MAQEVHNLLLDVKDITWGYDKSPSMLFHKFNFALYKNDFSILTGKAGSGKSTFVKFLLGQITPPLRTIYHKREDMARFTAKEIQSYRRKIGTIFQDEKLLDWMTARENIAYPLKIFGLGENIIANKVNKIIDKLHIQSLADQQVAQLTAPMQQKVAAARALIHDPEFIIADEPTAKLDWEDTKHLADILIEAHSMGNTVLLLTHDVHLMKYVQEQLPSVKLQRM